MEDFQIIKQIGDGAYSTVFSVSRKSDGRQYALKQVSITIPSLTLFTGENIKTESQREGQLLERSAHFSVYSVSTYLNFKHYFRHPNVVSYKEAFFDEITNSLCVVMDFAECGDLYNKIIEHKKNNSSFDEADIWTAFVHMVRGLKTLHDRKILHRDLKSANVFICKDGAFKLGDMNVSKIAQKDGLLHTQTGTPYYASPEVWKD
jgi:NIMA (never in mitosis gene a)-related kinase 1/4/5